jgi:hypothetical protein
MHSRLSKEKSMEDQHIDQDLREMTAERKRGLAGLLQRLRAGQQPPAPFRDSDFENVEWGRSGFDPRPGTAE